MARAVRAVTLPALLGTGVFLTLRMGFLPWRNLFPALKLLTRREARSAGGGRVSPLSTLMTALAATIGTGNIVGVATAITAGGPGALVWMEIAALFGLSAKFAECALAVKFRRPGEVSGGPMYTMARGIRPRLLGRGLAAAFAFFAVLASLGIGDVTQSNSIAAALRQACALPPALVGFVTAALTLVIIQGGIRRIAGTASVLVPVMALLWCQSAGPTGADELASAYSALFYSLPIINTILMPLAMAILASRLWDVEVKGCTPKLLYTLQSRRSLFAAKAALGLAEIFLIVTLEAAGAPLIGHLQHYTQPYPAAGQAAYLWGCTFAVDCMIFFSELLLTVLLANPLPALCVGILGTLLGLFSAFMPAWVGYFVPWGYFIPLSTYRIADWDQANKVVTYMIVPFQWPLLVATVVLAGILFFAAWYAMRNKEV